MTVLECWPSIINCITAIVTEHGYCYPALVHSVVIVLVISDLLNNYRLLLNVLDILLMSKVHKQVEPFSFYSIPQHL